MDAVNHVLGYGMLVLACSVRCRVKKACRTLSSRPCTRTGNTALSIVGFSGG